MSRATPLLLLLIALLGACTTRDISKVDLNASKESPQDVPAGNPDKLADVLTQARLTTLRTELAIDAHPDALHESVVLVIDSATAAGMQKIRIVSRSGGAE